MSRMDAGALAEISGHMYQMEEAIISLETRYDTVKKLVEEKVCKDDVKKLTADKVTRDDLQELIPNEEIM